MDEIIIAVKLTPKASRNEICGWEKDAGGNEYLKVLVTAVPEKGKANKALINLLSKTYRIAKSEISIISGETSRLKRIRISGYSLEILKS